MFRLSYCFSPCIIYEKQRIKSFIWNSVLTAHLEKQKQYSTNEQEAISVFLFLKRSRHYSVSRGFVIHGYH